MQRISTQHIDKRDKRGREKEKQAFSITHCFLFQDPSIFSSKTMCKGDPSLTINIQHGRGFGPVKISAVAIDLTIRRT